MGRSAFRTVEPTTLVRVTDADEPHPPRQQRRTPARIAAARAIRRAGYEPDPSRGAIRGVRGPVGTRTPYTVGQDWGGWAVSGLSIRATDRVGQCINLARSGETRRHRASDRGST